MEKSKQQNQIRGSLIGGAAGDALGYAVEFWNEDQIFSRYGSGGIRSYTLDRASGKALISDDTQMTLFTANGLLFAETRVAMRGIGGQPRAYMLLAYQDWLRTQTTTIEQVQKGTGIYWKNLSWLLDVPELYHRRAPGSTCLTALSARTDDDTLSFIDNPLNNSKGCGGVMRAAPMGLVDYPSYGMDVLDREGAELAAITHGHSLGYMPAAVLTHIVHQIVYAEQKMTLKEIVVEASDTVAEIFAGDRYLNELTSLIEKAIELSENDKADLDNIHMLGEGWVGEEALAIAIYCALRHQNDFSAGIIAAVNHKGDSDSTGAITGNILGAWLGFDAIDDRWKKDLELYDVILEMADDLATGCPITWFDDKEDPAWERKYINMRWKETT